MMRGAIATVMVGAVLWGPPAAAEESANSGVPAAFAPFEHMVGGWKGMGIPKDNPLKGWPETHQWAWKFAGGNPVAMTVTTEGGKVLKRGQLSFDAASRRYRLEGTDPAGKPVAFVGEANGAYGALRAVEQLQGVFAYRNAHQYPKRVFIPAIKSRFDGDRFVDAELLGRLREQCEGFASFVARVSNP